MSTFDVIANAPGILRTESNNITLVFDRTGPNTARVSWNIPTPAAGCTAETQAYCGIVVAVDTQPANASKTPAKGVVYSSDTTVDANLFAGDKLDTAMVVGAFYQDRTTTFVDISGLQPNTVYYASGYPTTCELQYFVEGVHAYSMEYKNRGTDDTHGSQVVALNATSEMTGALPTDATGLDAATVYDFKIQVGINPKLNRPTNPTDCIPAAPVYTINVDGANAQTIEALVAEINKQFALLSNGAQGVQPPNAGAYFWNASAAELYQWTGTEHVKQSAYVQNTAPNIVAVGTYWYDTSASQLNSWNGTSWVVVSLYTLESDPTLPQSDLSYWFNGTTAYKWNGVTWCELTTITQLTDPSFAPTIAGGTFWHDTTTDVLYRWNAALEMWSAVDFVQSATDPRTIVDNSLWYNPYVSQLYIYNIPAIGWNAVTNVSVSEHAPSIPAPGKYWYNPVTKVLNQRDATNQNWVILPVTVSIDDPTLQQSCDVWWDTTTQTYNAWNAVAASWVAATNTYHQAIDPSLPTVITEGSTWYNSTTSELYAWVNACYVPVQYTASVGDPTTTISVNDAWYKPSTNQTFIRTLSGWQAITPTRSSVDPQAILPGSFWYAPSVGSLQLWNGATWVSIAYTTSPLTPQRGTLWFDLTVSMLKEWNGSVWIAATPKVVVEHDCNRNLKFTDTNPGSTSYVSIDDGTLFKSMGIVTKVTLTQPGTDGASDTPSYAEVGIGTDGSSAVRDSIANEIRYELGYPVVDVELTQEQINYAIDRALNVLRQRSGLAYKRGFFFMAIKANEQRFFLTNKIQGMNKIVDVLGVYRMTSSFMSSAHGAGVYGQIVMQHMYNMGTFDLLSYHIMSDYTKLMEMLFAARITYTWNEQTRELWMHHRFSMNERMVCIEATMERTEQDILTDRYALPWIRTYAAGMCRLMLAEIRGKFSSLPGAGGSITLNADALRQAGQQDIDKCMEEIDSYIVDKPEEYGMGGQFTFG